MVDAVTSTFLACANMSLYIMALPHWHIEDISHNDEPDGKNCM